MSAGPHPGEAGGRLGDMKLSIVIPAFNEEKLLPGTLAAVHSAAGAFAASGLTHEVIVCDNNSTDRTAGIARAHGAAVIFEPVNQISRARNTGATLATGDWILFLDADSTPSYGLFSELVPVLHDPSVLYGGAQLEMDESYAIASVLVTLWHSLAQTLRLAAGSFMFMRREAFLSTGGFSTALYASEEVEYSRRLGKLASARGQRFAFLTHNPLITSARKLRFYNGWWHLRFILRTALCAQRNLRHRDKLPLWYDGRR